MAEERTFKVSADVRVYKTVQYLVTAESFDDARHMVECGMWDDIYDDYEDDEEVDYVNDVECYECDQDEDHCQCDRAEVDEQFFAGIGL